MLKLISKDIESQRKKYIEEFDTQSSTWLVSDLEHKKELQNFYLQKNGFLEEDACLRARELWLKLCRRQISGLHIVSNDFVKTLLSGWLKTQDKSFARGQTSTATLFNYMECFFPILKDKDSQENLRQWLKEEENKFAGYKWGGWFELSCLAWDFLLEKNVLPANWLASALFGEHEFKWQRKLFVDVGIDLNPIEAELLQQLSNYIDIVVFAPDEHWLKTYPQSLWIYESFDSEALPDLKNKEITACEQKLNCHEFNTQLVEVKFATAKIREWLESGVKADQISLYSCDPEVYWPAISSHFEVEGIPVNKSSVANLASFPQVGQWLAALRANSDSFSSTDLEAWLFSKEDLPNIKYQQFRDLLSRVYEEENLNFIPKIKTLRVSIKRQGELLLRDEFIYWGIRFYPEAANINDLEPIISRLLLECPEALQLALNEWIQLVEVFTSKIERNISPATPSGVQIKKLESSMWEKNPYRIIIGGDSHHLANTTNVMLSIWDIQKIGRDLGFYLPIPDSRRFEVLLNMNLNQPAKEIHFTTAHNDFNGEALSPSTIWSVNKMKHGSDSVKGDTRWDLLQLAQPDQAFFDQKSIDQQKLDKGIEVLPPIKDFNPEFLSATQIERFSECPFIFYASSGLGLRDTPDLVIDMDRMRRGRLVHKCLELLIQEGVEKKWTDSQLLDLIDRATAEEEIPYFKDLWNFQRQRLLGELKRVQVFESEWRQRFPATKTIATELDFAGEFYGTQFRGKIDRVDQTSDGKYILIDYKSSGSQAKSYKSWAENKHFQLYIYMLAMEKGWTEFEPNECVAAVYYNLKELDRNKGFLNKDIENPPYELKGSTVDSAGIEQLKKDCEQQLKLSIDQIRQGAFAPLPADLKTCNTCEWKKLCRAPHLNN